MKGHKDKKKLREFGFLIGVGFPIIIGWIIPSFSNHGFRIWTLWVAIPSLSLGILKPLLLFYPYKLWMKLGHFLGSVNSYLILGIFFILVVQPIALIMKIFGYDPLKLQKSKKKSYREIKEDIIIDLRRIF